MSSNRNDGADRAGDFERVVLRSAAADVPPLAGKKKLMLALVASGVPLAAKASAASAVACTAPAATATAVSGATVAASSGFAVATWMKLTFLAVMVGAASVGGGAWLHHHSHSGMVPTAGRWVNDPATAVVARPNPSAGTAHPSGQNEDATEPAIETSAASPLPATSKGAARPKNPRKLAEQIAILDEARSALAAGDRDRARRAVQRYRTQFPHGELSLEADQLWQRAASQ